jgi:ribonuclease-3
LTHRSAGSVNNERLEFLGDAVLNHLVAADLFSQFPQLDEGELSRLRASLVKGDMLATIAVELELGDYLLLGPGETKTGGMQRRSILAGALEAIIGAVYIDGGFEPGRACVRQVFGERIASVDLRAAQKDPKTRLQEYLQSRGMALPVYSVQDVNGPAHAQVFAVECHIESIAQRFTGTGSNRRKAEQDAAIRGLEFLQQDARP